MGFDQFQKGGTRACVPLVAGGQVLGVITLADRVSGLRLSIEDFDLLKSVGDQVAASLLNAQLSQHLLETKQWEAFQTMSAFFVHDLKNTASTLSLMLQNLPTHFNDPAFRQDALRGISKTVTHINDLINRLSLLRAELTVRPIETDLNDLVGTALDGLDQAPDLQIVKDLKPLPRLLVDPSQILKVFTNLLLNARDAVGKQGQIHIATTQRNGWAVLSVMDNGCGMSPEFLKRSLFRPFQTTKRQGIGIGMCQSKMIVDAHRGAIEVESEPGQGTTFRVLLPLPSEPTQA